MLAAWTRLEPLCAGFRTLKHVKTSQSAETKLCSNTALITAAIATYV
jgi:hypothetical protein